MLINGQTPHPGLKKEDWGGIPNCALSLALFLCFIELCVEQFTIYILLLYILHFLL